MKYCECNTKNSGQIVCGDCDLQLKESVAEVKKPEPGPGIGLNVYGALTQFPMLDEDTD
jgi:hypothetical protein